MSLDLFESQLDYSGGQKYLKGFTRTIFPSRMEIRCCCIYECCRVNIILFFFGNDIPVEKVYPGAVGIYFEMVHFLTHPTIFLGLG